MPAAHDLILADAPSIALSTACFCFALLISVSPARWSSSPDLIHDSAWPSGRTDPMAWYELAGDKL
jgi:hypothetical protein